MSKIKPSQSEANYVITVRLWGSYGMSHIVDYGYCMIIAREPH